MEGPCAIGRLYSSGPWIGFQADGAAALAVGTEHDVRLGPADDATLIALAIAYFDEAFDDPPPDLEATHEDISALLRGVMAAEPDDGRRRLLSEAVDAIDDGLAHDAVTSRLLSAMPRAQNEQAADPVDLLVERARALLRD
jgi:hypothetical protein